MSPLKHVIGPRIPHEELQERRWRYRIPNILLTIARVMILSSIFLPYWRMTLHAPQYPDGLHVTAFVNHLTGDVAEIDALNHYIGMRRLEEAAQFERAASVWLIIAMVLFIEGAGFIRTKWIAILAAPAIFFTPFFLLDLYFWLSHFGQNLNPEAPLSASIKPFTPPVLGTGNVGQFETIASAGEGFYLAAAAGVVIIFALFFHRRAYKPWVDAAQNGTE